MAKQMMQDKAIEMAATQTVPKGYKQTEVGVIPEDWLAVQLKQLFVLKNGYAFKGEFFSDKGPVVLTPGNFKLDGGLYFEKRNTKCYSATYQDSYELKKNDLVVVMTDLTPGCNLLGKPAFIEGDDVLLLNQRIGKVERLVNSWDKKFLFYTLLSPSYLSTIKNAATGSTVRHTSPNTIASAWVYEPPTQEQTAIANVLSDSDALIGALEQLIAKKQAIKTATMQQLLTGRTRLPQFALRPDGTPKGYKSSELGQIPEDWAVVAVSDVLSEISMGPFGSDIKVSNFVKSGVPVLNGINVSASKLVDSFSNFVTLEKAKELNKAVASRGDVVVTHRGTIGQISYIPDDSLFDKYVISQSQFRARFNNQVLPVWVVLFFLSPAGSARLLEGKGHTGVPAIAQATTTFRKLKFSLPSLEEQTAIATILSDMDSELIALEQKLTKARDLKQGMMQQLLTGRIRLPLEVVA